MNLAMDNKCPNCGANIKFDPKEQKLKCEYCGSVFEVNDFEKNSKVGNNTKNSDIDEYICQSCGAVLVTDENTTATHCVYCGNTAIMKNRLQGEFKPDKIIPFKTQKEEAIEEFKKNVKKKKFHPDEFLSENNIKEIEGVYIPFWLYDSNVDANITAIANRETNWRSGNYEYTSTEKFHCTRDGNVKIVDLPVDGSTKFQDDLMDSIEPYDYKEFTKFNKSYLSGFFAEKYDLSSEEVYDRAKTRMENTAIDMLKSTIRGYNSFYIQNSTTNINKGEVEYALLPVWMLNINFEEKNYIFAMNGQTKKFVGNVPVSKKKLIRKSILTFLLFFVISFIIVLIYHIIKGV